jgi:hypothetical protein
MSAVPSEVPGSSSWGGRKAWIAALPAKPTRSMPVTRQSKTVPYEIIGNLDGDISFDNDHFEFLLTKFSQHP